MIQQRLLLLHAPPPRVTATSLTSLHCWYKWDKRTGARSSFIGMAAHLTGTEHNPGTPLHVGVPDGNRLGRSSPLTAPLLVPLSSTLLLLLWFACCLVSVVLLVSAAGVLPAAVVAAAARLRVMVTGTATATAITAAAANAATAMNTTFRGPILDTVRLIKLALITYLGYCMV